ncbi:hypothetical protein BU14_0283s0004 [Porphyra umbilicalis]|uniref:Uncharacterized protein n=1 Tax=Porphyra umbilicalis TaxID=2786 RepID=A0A1X6P1E0_PORUM|nr:hypothetical protein BU14_0283s0004 [Porphyra umbilicalis]|eukprot:OSX74570.1 hypothetical protein BU14_0283s0004 [Porphyra umbilicalis]
MEVHLAKCSSCLQWISRDGREEHIVLLTLTSAATVSWIRSMALQTSEGTALTTCTTRWARAVRREMVAGVQERGGRTRSGRVLRNLVLTGLKMMVTQLLPALFTCLHCMDCDGRYKFVSADSIWVGFGSGSDHVWFEHITQHVPENERAVKAAYLVRGESIRRVIRDVIQPRKEVKVLSRTLRASEQAFGVLFPGSLPKDAKKEATPGEKAIGALLGTVFDIGAAAAKLLSSVRTGLATYKTRSRAEAQRRAAAAHHLTQYIATQQVSKASTAGTEGTATGGAPATTRPTPPPPTTTGGPPTATRPTPLPPPMATSGAPTAARPTPPPPLTTTGGAPVETQPTRPPPPAATAGAPTAARPTLPPPPTATGGAPTAVRPTPPPLPTSTGGALTAARPITPPPPTATRRGPTATRPVPPPPTTATGGPPTATRSPPSPPPTADGWASTAPRPPRPPMATGQAPPATRPTPPPPPGATGAAQDGPMQAAAAGLSRVLRADPGNGKTRGGGRNSYGGTATKGKRRKVDCGRQPFKPGKGDADADSPFLARAVADLDKDARRELLSFITAITIDSVVLPFRASQVGAVRSLAAMLVGHNHRQVLAELLAASTTTAEVENDDERKPIVDMLRELRFFQLGMRAAVALFFSLPTLAAALSNTLVCVADAIDNFIIEWRNGPEQTVEYEKKWRSGERSQMEMSRDFQQQYPSAAHGHERTGTCAPSLPQCRPEPFLWQDVLSTGMCSKHYAKAHKFSPGAMTICCGCKHPLILAFTVLDRKEAPQVLLNMLLTRFARIPRLLIYDFACGAFRVALGKVGWLLMDCTVVSDRFHIFNHLCSDAFDPRSYAEMDEADSGAPEQRNAPIRRIQTTLQGMGVEPYTNLLAYQTAILNHEAQTKWNPGVDRLSEDADLAGEYFCRFDCMCCDEPRSASAPGLPTMSSSDDGGDVCSDCEPIASVDRAPRAVRDADGGGMSIASSERASECASSSSNDSIEGGSGSGGSTLGE